jgi:hypothetical protein
MGGAIAAFVDKTGIIPYDKANMYGNLAAAGDDSKIEITGEQLKEWSKSKKLLDSTNMDDTVETTMTDCASKYKLFLKEFGWKPKFITMTNSIAFRVFLSHYMVPVILEFNDGDYAGTYVATRVNERSYPKFCKSLKLNTTELSNEARSKLVTKYLSYAVTCIGMQDIFVMSLILTVRLCTIVRMNDQAGYNRVQVFNEMKTAVNMWDIIKNMLNIKNRPKTITYLKLPEVSWHEIVDLATSENKHNLPPLDLTYQDGWDDGVLNFDQLMKDIERLTESAVYKGRMYDNNNGKKVIVNWGTSAQQSGDLFEANAGITVPEEKRIYTCFHARKYRDEIIPSKRCITAVRCLKCMEHDLKHNKVYGGQEPSRLFVVDSSKRKVIESMTMHDRKTIEL